MGFVRGVWRFLVGVKDALAVLLMLLLFAGIFAATRGASIPHVPDGSALVLDLDGFLVDQASEPGFSELLSGSGDTIRQIEVRNVIEAIHRAGKDKRIKSIVLDLSGFYGAGQANLQSVGTALKAFKAGGKPVYAYGTAYMDDGYYLAALANQAWVNPLGAVFLSGPGGTGLYFRDALDRLGVNVQVFRVGTYKAAVEPFTRADSSPEAKAANQALADSLWDNYVTDVQAARPKVKVEAMLADLPARVKAADGNFARQALADGFVDRIGTTTEFGTAMAKLVGAGEEEGPGSFAAVMLDDYLAASKSTRRTSGAGIGVVYVAGDIVDGDAPKGTAGGETIAGLIREAIAEDDIKALVVRIDSPGGSVTASEDIRQALIDAKAEGLPVVASFGPVAASGGYWVSTAADEVFAQPTTITGSIGVFALIPTFQRTLTKLGIGTDAVRSTRFSGEPDVLTGIGPATQALLQASVEDIYRRFTGIVAKARNIPVKRVDEIGQGRVWDGGTARQFGLVTAFGGLDEAVAAAAKRAGLDPAGVRVIDVEPSPSFPLALLEQMLGTKDRQDSGRTDLVGQIARASQLRAAASVAQALRLADGPSVQASCLSCAAFATPQVTARDRAALTRIARNASL